MGWGGSGKGYNAGKSWTPVWQPAFQKFGKGKGKGKGKGLKVDPSLKVWIGNVPPTGDWKALQAHMNQAGATKWVEIFQGRGAGTAAVTYGTPEEAANAIAMLNGSVLNGTQLMVDVWTKAQA